MESSIVDQISQNRVILDNNQHVEKEIDIKVTAAELGDDSSDDAHSSPAATKSTRDDYEDMRRMGKKQQLVRRFNTFSVASLAALATAAWELGLFLITPGLLDGGRPTLIYSAIWGFVGFGPIYLSMAEMNSMAPIAGGQYHWVSEFAPEGYQRILSYITGWTTTLAWQAGNALGVFLVGTLLQSLISINLPDYSFASWHATLLVFGAIIIAFIGNTYGAKVLPQWQNVVFIIHCLAYFAIIVPIWVKAPTATTRQVFLEFENNGGWPNMTLTVLIGQVVGIYNQVGIDTAAHMSEEVKDAARSVPRAMITIYVVNFVLIFPAMLTICYHMPVVTDALDDPTTYPAIYVMRQAMSPGFLTAMLAITIVLLTASNISYMAAVTRDMFAFARDQGLPFSNWLSAVHPKLEMPWNACLFTSFFGGCLALIYIGSPVAFYAITSLCTVALLQGYMVSIGCILWRRIKHPETLPPAKFSLGKYGVPINVAALAFSAWSFFWTFWPQASPVTAEGFNWASVLFLLTVIVAMVDFAFRGRHKYNGPVTSVRGRFANTE